VAPAVPKYPKTRRFEIHPEDAARSNPEMGFNIREVAPVKVEQADAADEQRQRPGPAAAQIREGVEETTQTDDQEQDRRYKSGQTDPKKPIVSHPSSERPDPVVDRRIGGQAVGGNIPRMIREQSSQQQHRQT
jgi:hypothetical protein